jgi:hypothetical protein
MNDAEYIDLEMSKAVRESVETVNVKARSDAGESRWVAIPARVFNAAVESMMEETKIMDDETYVFPHCRERRAAGIEIDHGVARTIASWYHNGGITATIALSSTGTITDDLTMFMLHEGDYDSQPEDDRLALDMLWSYVEARRRAGDTGKVPGWDNMWADSLGGTPGVPAASVTHHDGTPNCGRRAKVDLATKVGKHITCPYCYDMVNG